MDKVSVIVPVYNVEKYIFRCLKKLINQTYTEIEIIVVNDGSTDGSTGIVDNFAKRDSRIVHVRQKNSGLSAARNKGLSLASGKYILFVDGDDYIAENCIETLLNEICKDEEIDVVCFPYVKLFKNRRELAKIFPHNKVFSNDEVKSILLQKLIGPTDEEICKPWEMSRLNTAWGKLYRKEAIANCFFIDTKIIGVEDGWFNICVFAKVRKTAYTEGCLYFYEKENGNSLLHNYSTEYFERRKTAYKMIYSFLHENDLKIWTKNLQNRIVIDFIEIYRKIINSGLSLSEKKTEIKKVLTDQTYCKAMKQFKIRNTSFVWRVFWMLCRKRRYNILAALGAVIKLYQRIHI